MNQKETMHGLLEVGDVARLLDLSPDAVRRHARTGNLLVAVTTRRGSRLFLPSAVERFRLGRRRVNRRRLRAVTKRIGRGQGQR